MLVDLITFYMSYFDIILGMNFLEKYEVEKYWTRWWKVQKKKKPTHNILYNPP